MRVALFGGSFDPPHCGHIKIARAAKTALNLDKILMAPVGKQPLKAPFHNASFQDRLQMVALAVAEEEGIEACNVDAPRADDRPNYTLDTLKKLREELAPDTKLFFLMGADSLQSFRKWHQAAELLVTAEFIIAARPGFSLSKLAKSLPEGVQLSECLHSSPCVHTFSLTTNAGKETRLHLLPNLHEEVSATDVRRAIRTGNEKDLIVPSAVLKYIRKNNLYK